MLVDRSPLLLLAVACALTPGSARAQSATDQATAEALFREGRKLYDQGHYPEACAKLAESQRLDPAPGTLLNLAGCYEKNGQTASAWATFQSAIAAAHRKGRADWEELARSRVATLEPALSRLTIVVPAPPEGLTVRRDGAEIGSAVWGTPIPVDPGPHTVEASAPGRQTFRQSVDVAAGGARATVTVADLAPVVGETRAGAAENGGGARRTIGVVLAGAGLVGLAVGAAFGVVAMSKENDATSNHCPHQPFCDAQGVQLGQDAKSAATVSTVAFAAGAAAVAGGVVLWFTAPGPGSPNAGQPAAALRATPVLGGAVLGFRASW
jgi:serine/threonine-protein kinase